MIILTAHPDRISEPGFEDFIIVDPPVAILSLEGGVKEEGVVVWGPEDAYYYALSIRGRWPEAEPIICQKPRWAYCYAADIIKKRWPEAEDTIRQDPAWAYSYAHEVVCDRWPEAEDVIRRDPEFACWYALDVIGGRWPEAERTILADPEWADIYSRYMDRQ